MPGYYAEKLSTERLRKVYDIAPPRARQYLEAEIGFVLDKIKPTDTILELGCGYGRALDRVAHKSAAAIGIDTSYENLIFAQKQNRRKAVFWLLMDAASLGFKNDSIDVVICIQNGISAFHVDQRTLIEEAMRVAKPGGMALFSSYSENFWEDRLEWFELQAQQGLLGDIDYDATGDGVIVCKDGFRATTITPEKFAGLTSGLGTTPIIEEVDRSSIFCLIPKL